MKKMICPDCGGEKQKTCICQILTRLNLLKAINILKGLLNLEVV